MGRDGQPRVLAWLVCHEFGASLAVFRMFWGGLLAWESIRYLQAGWVKHYYIAPNFLFKYVGFEWVHALPGSGMYVVYGLMVASAVTVALGVLYRTSAVVLFVTHTYVFLVAASNYLNHAYLIALLAFLMIFVPAANTLSVDAWWRGERASPRVPRWGRYALIGQIGLVYFYGGIAKLNTDWLVYHQPMRRWMKGSANKVAWAHDFIASEAFTMFVCYAGVLLDLFIVPLLLWKRTRMLAVVTVSGFHIANSQLFNIGVFPWMMLAATTLFLEPDWPYRLPWLGDLLRRLSNRGSSPLESGPLAAPWSDNASKHSRVGVALAAWFAVQLLLPLRHHLYPGDVVWNEQGHLYSWRMKLRSKLGSVRFRVVDRATGRTWYINPRDDLSLRQARKIRGKPEFIRQYAVHLVERYRDEDGVEVDVYVDATAGVNYRKTQQLLDPEYELGHEPGSLAPYRWITAFEWTEPPHPGRVKTEAPTAPTPMLRR